MRGNTDSVSVSLGHGPMPSKLGLVGAKQMPVGVTELLLYL